MLTLLITLSPPLGSSPSHGPPQRGSCLIVGNHKEVVWMEPVLLVSLSPTAPQYSERYFDVTGPSVNCFQVRLVDEKTLVTRLGAKPRGRARSHSAASGARRNLCHPTNYSHTCLSAVSRFVEHPTNNLHPDGEPASGKGGRNAKHRTPRQVERNRAPGVVRGSSRGPRPCMVEREASASQSPGHGVGQR
jgi:hypothetical protein